MNVALRPRMTVAEFLAWEERQEYKHEFDGFRPVAMNGVTVAHSTIQVNLAATFCALLRGTPCRFFGSDLKIVTDATVRYPDGIVVCTQPKGSSKFVTDPVVIFEVLSPSTARTDRTAKNREYAALPSVQRYVMLEQDEISAMVFSRAGEDWIGRVVAGDGVLDLPEIGVSLPLAELYEGLDLSAPEPEKASSSL